MILWPSYIHNGIFHVRKMTSLYRIKSLFFTLSNCLKQCALESTITLQIKRSREICIFFWQLNTVVEMTVTFPMFDYHFFYSQTDEEAPFLILLYRFVLFCFQMSIEYSPTSHNITHSDCTVTMTHVMNPVPKVSFLAFPTGENMHNHW